MGREIHLYGEIHGGHNTYMHALTVLGKHRPDCITVENNQKGIDDSIRAANSALDKLKVKKDHPAYRLIKGIVGGTRLAACEYALKHKIPIVGVDTYVGAQMLKDKLDTEEVAKEAWKEILDSNELEYKVMRDVVGSEILYAVYGYKMPIAMAMIVAYASKFKEANPKEIRRMTLVLDALRYLKATNSNVQEMSEDAGIAKAKKRDTEMINGILEQEARTLVNFCGRGHLYANGSEYPQNLYDRLCTEGKKRKIRRKDLFLAAIPRTRIRKIKKEIRNNPLFSNSTQ
jgi:hypothetical protein